MNPFQSAFDSGVGHQMPDFVTPPLTRTHFVRYAGASGDFNPLHHDDEFARARKMPSVIGHGMLTAGLLGQSIARWAGPEHVRRFRVRFSRPVLPGDVLTCGGRITRTYMESGLQRVDLECWVKNQKDVTVLEGSATIGPHR